MNGFLDDFLNPPKGTTFSVSPENVYGKPGAGGMDTPGQKAVDDVKKIGQQTNLESPHPARELGQKYKVRPWISILPNQETTIFDHEGPGIIRHFWITVDLCYLRRLIIRMYWDHETTPSVETPLGDLFCCTPGYYGEIQSLAVCVNPLNGLNLYLPMPFRKHARITLEHPGEENPSNGIFYTFNCTQEPVAEDTPYFHASFRRTNPVRYGEDFVIADGIRGKGRFAGCYLTWQQNNSGWWGEGEVKMFLDGDREFPSICGTGTEDYFCGAWGFKNKFSSPYSGYHCGGKDAVGARHALYRFHITDPIWFHSEFKATIQTLGWRSERRFLPLQDDLSCVAYWYQSEPHAPLPPVPDRNGLEVI